MSEDLRIVFMGTPDFAAGVLDALIQAKLNIVGVITAPDKPAGRGQQVSKSAVKTYAETLTTPLLQPTNLKDEQFIADLKALEADLFIVVAFRMLPEVVWAMPPKGTINLHASLLPQYRGAAPINWAVVNGETVTGVTTFFIEKEIDTGMILAKEEVKIHENMTAGELHDELLEVGKRLVVNSVGKISTNDFTKIPQIELISGELKAAPKIFKNDCLIQWNQNADTVHNFIRGFSPYPTAWTHFNFTTKGDQKTAKIFKTIKTTVAVESHSQIKLSKNQLLIPCKDYYLEVLELQIEGKKKMSTKEFLAGYHAETIEIA